MKVMQIKIFVIILVVLLMPLTSALDSTAQQNQPYNIRVTPAANGTIETVTANITINDPDGLIITAFQVMQKNILSQDFNWTVQSQNTSKLGFYDCTVYAFSSIADNKVLSCGFEVNPTGKEYIPEITGPLMFGGILTMMFISCFLLIVGSKMELFPMKVFLIILSGIVAILNIGFVAGSFQEFFSADSTLSGSIGTLYITFIFLMTAASIFLLMWIVLAGFKLYRIKRGFYIEP